jgi:hypothetical protein
LQALFTESLTVELPFPPSQVAGLGSWLLLQALFTDSSHGQQLLALPSFSGALKAPHPLYCISFFSSLFIIHFFFAGWESVCPGVVVGILHAICLLTCWSASPKQAWSQRLASSWCFFSTKCGSSVSASFLIYGSHAVCFLPPTAKDDIIKWKTGLIFRMKYICMFVYLFLYHIYDNILPLNVITKLISKNILRDSVQVNLEMNDASTN